MSYNEPPHDKTNIMACAPSEVSDQPGHPPSLISVFIVRLKKAWVLSYPLSAQRRLWADWVDTQADMSLRWAHMPFSWVCHEAALIVNIILHSCSFIWEVNNETTSSVTKIKDRSPPEEAEQRETTKYGHPKMRGLAEQPAPPSIIMLDRTELI